MNKDRVALIIGTEVATNGFESGAALRLDSIKNLLENAGFKTSVASRGSAKIYLKSDWDLVVLVSFSTSSLLRLARKRSKMLWFDPTDSWTLTRLSLLFGADFKQAFILMRDLFFIWTSPKIDLITFISERDSNKEKLWWVKRSVPFILSIEGLDREIKPAKYARLVFSGDGRYRPNQKALKFLSKTSEFLPSDLQIHLMGRDLRSTSKRFKVHGYLSHQEMYFSHDIHLAPIEHGGGLKLKVAVPLWNGLRVISTPEGSNGFKKSARLKIASTPRDFAEQISEFLREDNHGEGFKPRNEIYLRHDNTEVRLWLKNFE
jgi:hypothetical protein